MANATDYTNLVTSEHRDKPNFIAMVGITAQAFTDQVNTLNQMVFDLDAATGTMLDYIGQWIGFSRIVAIPLNIYFSLDTAGLGFDQGIWFAPFDPVNGTTRLDDDTYRRLLKARAGINTWDSTISGFNAIMAKVFAGTGVVAYGRDMQDRTINAYISATIPLVLKSLIDSGVMLPKSAGIVVNVVYF